MPNAKLSNTYVHRLEAGAQDVIHWDLQVQGFGVKVTPKGRKVFLVQYRPNGHVGNARKLTIGTFGDFTADQARRKALEVVSAKAHGKDPQAEKRATKLKYGSDRFCDVLERFINQHVVQTRSARETERLLRKDFLSAWGTRSIHLITKRDVNEVLDRIRERGSAVMANRALAAIRKLFNWCLSKDIVERSPCTGISAPTRERSRDRVLADDELRVIILAARQMAYPFGPIVEVLALTGQRRDEVARMRWQDINPAKRLWTIPAEHAKNGKAHLVHLSDAALAVINAAPKHGPLVFSTDGHRVFGNWNDAKRRLDGITQGLSSAADCPTSRPLHVRSWRLHDLRRTIVTGMVGLGVRQEIADKILNHQTGALSAVGRVY